MRPVPRAAIIAGVVSMLAAGPAAGFELDGGCTVVLTSTDEDGATVDSATGPGPGGTQDDPFLVDWDGTVSWAGDSGDVVFNDHSWQVRVFLVPVLFGGDPNEEDETTATGSADVSESAPFRTTGLYHVSGEINGAEGTHCDGSGWFKLEGDPVVTVPFWLAILIAAAGAALVYASRPHVTATTTTVQGSPSP